MKGFTIVEVLVLVVIAAITGAIIVSIFVQNNGLFLQQTSRVSQGVSINDASSEITEAVRSASGIVTSNTVGSPQYTTSSETLVLQIPSIDSSDNLIENKYDYIILTKDLQKSNILRKIIFVDPASARKTENRVLITKLSNIAFSYLDSNNNPVSPTTAIKINYVINLSEKSGYNKETASASSEVNLRNN